MLTLLLLVFLPVVTAFAADSAMLPSQPPQGISADLWERMKQIDAKAATIKDSSADFEQKKISPLLKKPLVSTGVVYVRGGVMLWDTRAPEPTIMGVDDKNVTLYYPNQQTAEVYPIGGQLADMASSPIPRLADLLKHFTIAPAKAADLDEKPQADHEAFLLKPTDKDMQQHVDRVTVLIDAKLGVICKLAVVDAEGETTVISFAKVSINSGLEEKRVQLTLPPGTHIVHPLENAGP